MRGKIIMSIVKNQYDVEIDFESAVYFMSDKLCECLNNIIAPCSDQEFFDTYCKIHKDAFSEEFELNKENPVW